MAAVNFTAAQIDVADLLEYLKSGGYIDCGELKEDRIDAVRMIANLGLTFPMGAWFNEIEETGIPWRYLYLNRDADDEDYPCEIHMLGGVYGEDGMSIIRFEEIPMRFPADAPDSVLTDITDLYPWWVMEET